MDKITDLPTAIRVGSLQHPQCFHKLVIFTNDILGIRNTCALGAAGVAVGILKAGEYWDTTRFTKRFDIDYELMDYIEGLNDDRRLSRETIAAILHAREWAPYNHQEDMWTK